MSVCNITTGPVASCKWIRQNNGNGASWTRPWLAPLGKKCFGQSPISPVFNRVAGQVNFRAACPAHKIMFCNPRCTLHVHSHETECIPDKIKCSYFEISTWILTRSICRYHPLSVFPFLPKLLRSAHYNCREDEVYGSISSTIIALERLLIRKTRISGCVGKCIYTNALG